MSVVAIIKNKSSIFSKVEPITVEDLAEFSGNDLSIGKYSAIDYNKFREYDKKSIPINNYGQIYLGVEKESSRGVGLFFDENKNQYEVKLNQPCSQHDGELFSSLVSAISKYAGQPVQMLKGSVQEAADILIHWDNLYNMSIDADESISICGFNLDVWFDNDFLKKFNSGEELMSYYFKHQWLNNDSVAIAEVIQPKKDLGIGIWTNFQDKQTVYPFHPVVPTFLKIDPSIVKWILLCTTPETKGLPSSYVDYNKFVEFFHIEDEQKIGANHFRILITSSMAKELIDQHGKPLADLLK